MKKKYRIYLLFLFVIPLTLFCGCQKKSMEPYGKVQQDNYQISYVFESSEVREGYENRFGNDFPATIAKVLTFHFDFPDNFQVLDVQSANKKVTYIVDDPQTVDNAVVVTKWMYYYSVLNKKVEDERDSTISIPITQSFIDALFADEYCMEKVKLTMPTTYIIKNESSDYYGMTMEEAFRKAGVDETEYYNHWLSERSVSAEWMTPSSSVPLRVDPNDIDNDVWEMFTKNISTLGMAAFARYGAIKTSALTGDGRLSVYLGKDVTDETGKKIGTKYGVNPIELNVVGYIETEADKLLSTGVSMDKNSEEYKIVMQQLQNPVIYSVCGNFLEEVNS